MANKTTRIRTTQAPTVAVYDLTDQLDGVKETFTLPAAVNPQANHYLIYSHGVYRNGPGYVYYTLSNDGKTLNTHFDSALEPLPEVGPTLQLVAADYSEDGNTSPLTEASLLGHLHAALTSAEKYTDDKVYEINEKIKNINRPLEFFVVQDPTHLMGFTNRAIYFAPSKTPGTNNKYDEYVYVEGEWERIGSTDVDLSNYYTKTEVDTALANAGGHGAPTYTKAEVDNIANAKADKTTTYSKTDVDGLLNNKVDKEAGKGLSTNDYTTAEKDKLAGIEAQANKTVVDAALNDASENPVQNKAIKTALDSKVDKEAGKTLTSNDFTTELKDKLTAVEAGAQVNKIEEIKTADGVALTITDKSVTLPAATAAVDAYTKAQSDDKYVAKEAGKTLTSNDFTDELKTKLEGVSTGANKNVQADWNEADTDSDAFIKNKPVIPAGSVLYDATGTHTDGSITQKVITEELNKKVDKVDGKSLSTNDFTNELKDKLNAVNENGEANVLNGIKTADGNELTIADKKITLPNFALKSDISSVYKVKGSKANKAELDDIVDKEVGDVYNLTDTGVNYVWTGTEWDSLSGNVDLTGYYTKTQADDKFVVKEAGKGLSDNNFTLMDKAKLGSIEHSAQVNKIEEIQTSDGTPLTITDKKVKLPELTVDAYTKAQADGKFVAKETGKGLSTNDLTNELKAKIENAKNGGAYLSTTRLEQTIGQSKVIAIDNVNGLTIDKVVENGTLIYDDNNGIGVVEEIAGNALKVKTISLGSITNTKNDIQLTYAQDFYSQHEQTVGFYMGKPLYQITIPKLFPSKPSGTQEVGVIPGLERVVEVDGVVMNAGSQVSYLVSHNEMGGTKFINITGDSNSGKISITVGSAMPNGPYLVELTVKYTKKTDVAKNENARPINQALINRPDLWETNKAYSFGNDLVGVRFKGAVNTTRTTLDIPTDWVGTPVYGDPKAIVNYNLMITNAGDSDRYVLTQGYYGPTNFISGLFIQDYGRRILAFESEGDYNGKPYDIWALVTFADPSNG